MESQVVCRVCGINECIANTFSQLYGDEASQLRLLYLIKKYTPIELDESDKVSKLICSKCKDCIVGWHQFWENCLKVENDLKYASNNEEEIIKSTCTPDFSGTSNTQLQVVENEKHSTTDNTKSRFSSNKIYRSFYCIAKWCTSNNTTSTMFRIPKDERRLTWLIRASREDLIGLELPRLRTKYLCDKHFTGNMFNNSTRKSLIWNALPTIFQTEKKYKCSALSEKDTSDMNLLHSRKRCKLKVTNPQSSSKTDNVNQGQNVCTSLKPADFNNATQMLQIPFQQQSSNVNQVLVVSSEQLLQCNFLRNLKSCKRVRKLSPNMPRSLLQIRDPGKHLEKSEVQQNETVKGKMESTHKVNVSEIRKSTKCDLQNCDNKVDLSVDQDDMSYNYSCLSSTASNVQKFISRQKSPSVCNVVAVDTVEHLKESDVDSLCSGQGFRECMYPCLACGEVFLMKSSLDQHCKTYHDANFYASSG